MHNPLSLTQLSEKIRDTIGDTFPFATPVIAEISEMNINRNGHCYIELIEQINNKIAARIRGIIYANRFPLLQSYFNSVTGHPLQVGLKVLIMVRLSYHQLYGLSVEVNDIDPKYTLGDLEQQRKLVIERLHNQGVIDMNRSLDIPEIIKKIAIISSSTAAGYDDFIKHLNSNPYKFRFQVDLYEAYMQGAQTISSFEDAVNAIFESNTEYDVIIIIRGGGSKAELAIFDSYEIAYLVTQLPIPVLTGIGHERDTSVVDYVANQDFKTPTAVADFIVQINLNALETLEQLQNILKTSCTKIFTTENENLLLLENSLKSTIHEHLVYKQNQIVQLENRLNNSAATFSYKHNARLTRLKNLLQQKTKTFFAEKKHDIVLKKQTLEHLSKYTIQKEEQKLNLLDHKIKLSDPQHILNLGYALVVRNGQKITDSKMLKTDDTVNVLLKSGKFKANVSNID